ncbi:MAG: CapA family protein [Acidimicrobiales bacterium]
MAPLAVLVIAAGTVVALDTTRGATSPTTTTTTTLPPVTTTTAPPTVTIAAVGDTELGDSPQLPSNPGAYLRPITAALAAPIVFGNLEGTITDSAQSKCVPNGTTCYTFRVPRSYAAIYRSAGFTVMNSANNHAYDFGQLGVSDTSTALKDAGIVQAGLPGQIGVVDARGVKVAFVDFAPYYNTNNMLDFPAAARLIARAHQLANVVVVYMHAGAEGASADHVTRQSESFYGENRGNPYAFAHAAINDGADLVIASGPHVLRGMEWFKGHLIDYSLGDFANYYDFSAAGVLDLSAIVHVTLDSSGGFVSGTFTSVRLSTSGQPSVDPTRASATFVNDLSRADFGANAALIGTNGSILPAR